MGKSFFHLDERNVNILCRICTIMYGVILLMLMVAMSYRQYVLDQRVEEFRDIANIFTFNVVFVFGAILYFGGVTFPKIKPLALVAIYAGFVLIGFLFTIFRYTILLDRQLSMSGMLQILTIVSTICAAFVAVYALFAYFGKRKIDKEIE